LLTALFNCGPSDYCYYHTKNPNDYDDDNDDDDDDRVYGDVAIAEPLRRFIVDRYVQLVTYCNVM